MPPEDIQGAFLFGHKFIIVVSDTVGWKQFAIIEGQVRNIVQSFKRMVKFLVSLGDEDPFEDDEDHRSSPNAPIDAISLPALPAWVSFSRPGPQRASLQGGPCISSVSLDRYRLP